MFYVLYPFVTYLLILRRTLTNHVYLFTITFVVSQFSHCQSTTPRPIFYDVRVLHRITYNTTTQTEIRSKTQQPVDILYNQR
jgi:hypothetical protein